MVTLQEYITEGLFSKSCSGYEVRVLFCFLFEKNKRVHEENLKAVCKQIFEYFKRRAPKTKPVTHDYADGPIISISFKLGKIDEIIKLFEQIEEKFDEPHSYQCISKFYIIPNSNKKYEKFKGTFKTQASSDSWINVDIKGPKTMCTFKDECTTLTGGITVLNLLRNTYRAVSK